MHNEKQETPKYIERILYLKYKAKYSRFPIIVADFFLQNSVLLKFFRIFSDFSGVFRHFWIFLGLKYPKHSIKIRKNYFSKFKLGL